MAGGLVERRDERIAGVLSCYGRIIIAGALPGVCRAKGMTAFLYANDIRIFDYPQFAAGLRDAVRENAAMAAGAAGAAIEHISKNRIRKESIVARAIAGRGDHPGLAHVVSAVSPGARRLQTVLSLEPDACRSQPANTRVKRRFGESSVGMHDKFGVILRIETTANDVSSFKRRRKAERRNAPATTGFAPMKKNIYSLGDLAGILCACNRRRLAHLSALDDCSDGVRLLDRVARTRKADGETIARERPS